MSHYFHRVVVEAGDEHEAEANAEGAIEGYGDGRVWDWYAVGGRWDGALGGKNVIRYIDDPKLFLVQLKQAFNSQNSAYLEVQRALQGIPYTADDAPEWLQSDLEDLSESHGELTEKTQRWVEMRNQALQKDHDDITKLLNASSLGEVPSNFAGYRLRELTKLVDGCYMSASYFFDGIDHTASPIRLIKLIEEDTRILNDLWMVGMDLHN